jgi:hypothetical protein
MIYTLRRISLNLLENKINNIYNSLVKYVENEKEEANANVQTELD